MTRIRCVLTFFAGMAVACVFTLPSATAEDGPAERPACEACKGSGTTACYSCKGMGRVTAKPGAKPTVCSACSGKGKTTCFRCRGSGKRVILQDLIPKDRRAACGVTKLTVAEQEALSTEVFRIYYDPWGRGAAEYLESEGWSKVTVTKVLKRGLLVENAYGSEFQLEDSLPLLSVDEGEALWLESEYGLTDVIDSDGEKGSYSVE